MFHVDYAPGTGMAQGEVGSSVAVYFGHFDFRAATGRSRFLDAREVDEINNCSGRNLFNLEN